MLNNKLQDKFLERIGKLLYPRERETEEQMCFPLRWHPVNHSKPHTYIEEEMVRLRNSNVSNINQVISRGVAQKIWRRFQAEMTADGFTVERTGERGQPRDESQSPYLVTYKWLWEKQFPRMAWELAKELADPVTDAMKMISADSNQRISDDCIPEDEDILFSNQKYHLKVNLPDEAGYLLLINETADGRKYLVSPSKAFAHIPVCPLAQPLYFPPDHKSDRCYLDFNSEKELFLAIVTQEKVIFPWIDEKTCFQLDGYLLSKVFQEVGKLADVRVYQKYFRVKIV